MPHEPEHCRQCGRDLVYAWVIGTDSGHSNVTATCPAHGPQPDDGDEAWRSFRNLMSKAPKLPIVAEVWARTPDLSAARRALVIHDGRAAWRIEDEATIEITTYEIGTLVIDKQRSEAWPATNSRHSREMGMFQPRDHLPLTGRVGRVVGERLVGARPCLVAIISGLRAAEPHLQFEFAVDRDTGYVMAISRLDGEGATWLGNVELKAPEVDAFALPPGVSQPDVLSIRGRGTVWLSWHRESYGGYWDLAPDSAVGGVREELTTGDLAEALAWACEHAPRVYVRPEFDAGVTYWAGSGVGPRGMPAIHQRSKPSG